METIWLSDYAEKATLMAQSYKILFSYEPATVRAEYPNAKVIAWVGFGFVWEGWGLAEARANNYVLKDATDKEVFIGTNALVDPANPNYQAWLAEECKSVCERFPVDGIFGDGASVTHFEAISPYDWPVNPRTGRPYTDHDYAVGFQQLARAVKTAIGDKLLIGNGGAQTGWQGFKYFNDYSAVLEILDGGMAEAMFRGWGAGIYPDEAGWLKELEWIKWHTSQPKFFLSWIQSGEPSYVFGSILLAATNLDRIAMGHGLGGDWLGDVKNWLTIDFGVPVGNYFKIPDTSVYERNFTNIKVLVNPSDLACTVQVKGAEGPVTVNPHTAVILSIPTPPPSGCFIATACYGSPTNHRVCQLRKLKDAYVARSRTASLLYRLYYVFSPSVANFIRERENLKKPIRTVIEWLAQTM